MVDLGNMSESCSPCGKAATVLTTDSIRKTTAEALFAVYSAVAHCNGADKAGLKLAAELSIPFQKSITDPPAAPDPAGESQAVAHQQLSYVAAVARGVLLRGCDEIHTQSGC